ncbi:MAG: flagellar filament capping protein FliD [Selenomonadaceae bacterium]|nr:flagellar filament capping protein FliD [Selenomonadaceae bacterium]MBR7025714.1 flagellar filament capping protein FliD [Selenomonadaceae bacterium]
MSGINSLGGINNYSWLFGSNNQKQNSAAQLWNAYGNFQSNATSSLAGLTEVNSNLKAVLASYDDAKTAFSSEFKETMSDLSSSAAKVKEYNFQVAGDDAISTKTETDKDGNVTTTTTYSKELQAAIDTVKNFVDDYNSAVNFFGDNSSVSKRVEMMATTFSDTTYRASSLATIGLTVNSNGSMTINEAKLAETIVNDPGKISSVLGKDGLAGKAESHVTFANSQADKLFPTAQAMIGDQLETASVYTGKAYRNMTAASNMGNLINMMF